MDTIECGGCAPPVQAREAEPVISAEMVKAYRDMYATGCASFYTEDMRVAQALEAALAAQ